MLEGKQVDLRLLEKTDLDIFSEWNNDPNYGGEYEPLEQTSRTAIERWFELEAKDQWFIIQTKDGTPVGQILHFKADHGYGIGYIIHPDYRKNEYATEAVQLLVNYIFLAKDTVRVQAEANPENIASTRVLKKAGFTYEGLIRKANFIRGEYRDGALYSILREEWNEARHRPP